jgi:hypothetical protein
LSAHHDLGESVTLHQLLGLCLQENDRRTSRYSPKLLRPRLVPTIARILYGLLPTSL